MAPKSDLLQGTLDLLILRTLAKVTRCTAGASRCRSSSCPKDVLQINQGSLYPALHRLEQQGLIEAEWGNSENNRQAKFYQLTREGGSSSPRRHELGAPVGRRRARAGGPVTALSPCTQEIRPCRH